jgi:hypothetical protein
MRRQQVRFAMQAMSRWWLLKVRRQARRVVRRKVRRVVRQRSQVRLRRALPLVAQRERATQARAVTR